MTMTPPVAPGNDPSSDNPSTHPSVAGQPDDSNSFGFGRQWFRSLTTNLKSGIKIKVALFFLLAPLAAGWLFFKFVALPIMASNALAVWAEGQGMDLTVEDWSAEILDLSATAHDIVLVAPGPYAKREFLTAEALVVDLSLWNGLFGDRWIREVRVTQPRLYLERLAAGRWNWTDVANVRLEPGRTAVPAVGAGVAVADLSADVADSFSLPRVVFEDMALQWVETLPAESGGGVIQELKASLHVDDIHLTISDLVGLVDLRAEPTRLGLEARTGNGVISFDGRGNLFSWGAAPPPGNEAEGQIVRAAAVGPNWSPSLSGRIYLENIEAGAFARLTPGAAILPDRGTLTGSIEFAVRNRQLESCVANVNLRDVTFAINEASPLVGPRKAQLQRSLEGYRSNGQFQFSCGGELGTDTFRPFQAFQTNIVQQGLREASRTARAVAAIEHSQYSEEDIEPELRPEVAKIAETLPPEAAQKFGVKKFLQWLTTPTGRAVTEVSLGLLDRLRRRF